MKWLKPVNVTSDDGFRVIDAFKGLGCVEYYQGAFSFKVGDIVYFYAGEPEQRIIAKSLVVEADQYEITLDQSAYSCNPDNAIRRKLPFKSKEPIMRLELICEYEKCKELSIESLVRLGVRGSIRTPRRVNGRLEEYLSRVDGKHIAEFYSDTHRVNCYEKIMSFPCGATYDITCKWGVHAHPIKRGQPPQRRMTRCMIVRAHAGITETLYEIENTVDVDPDRIRSVRNELDDKTYRRLLNYHEARWDMDYGYLSGYVFRFYIFRAIHEFRPKLQWERNARNVEYIDVTDLSLPKSVRERIGIAQGKRIMTNKKLLEEAASEEELVRHARRMDDEELRRAAKKNEKKKVTKRETTVKQMARDPYIVEFTKRKANGRCQLCGKQAPFSDKEGYPYLESHHIVWLSKGGADTIDNSVALCPNCHRKMHVVNEKKDISRLQQVARRNAKNK